MSAPTGKGFVFKSKKIQEAPPALKELPTPLEEALSMKPSPLTSVRGMFESTAAVPAPVAVTAPIAKKPVVKKAVPPPAPEVESIFAPVAAHVAAPAPAPIPEATAESSNSESSNSESSNSNSTDSNEVSLPEDRLQKLDIIEDEDLQLLTERMFQEELDDPYEVAAPQAYVPENRRSFANFIRMTYDDFSLKPVGEALPVLPGDKYPYQKFVREYIRQASPYRGVLVYHGLGSGKTCTSIAASEALFSTAGKKIIVMTPFSLRKNFLKEVSFCGFRHFRLDNHWTALDKKNPSHLLFAQEILGLSSLYLRTATSIWVPDFREAESNYADLPSEEQTEIRKQILAQLIWHPTKSPNGRIRFINYNGITKKALKDLACKDQKFFDNSVIIIDEIHNLVRLMQGKIEKYLVPRATRPELQVLESVTPGPYVPKHCEDTAKPYERGYLLYRLLLSAKNTKIIGLSGTPIINFPEELGILANILHGYQNVIEINFSDTSEEAIQKMREISMSNAYTDFVGVQKGTAAVAGTRLTLTLLQPGFRKVAEGVERIPREEPQPTYEETVEELKRSFTNLGLKIKGEPAVFAEPILPPFGEPFRNNFLAKDALGLKNTIVLGKRLSGLISYYKGSRQDLMPAIAKDEVVRVPFSSYAQKQYSIVRLEEIQGEMKKKKPTAGLEADIFDSRVSTSGYRMGSRQKCNFSFPPGVNRPKPRSRAEQDEELGQDRDIPDTAPDLEVEGPVSTFTMDDLEEEEEEDEDYEDDEDEDEDEEDDAGEKAPAQTISLKKLMKSKAARDCKTPLLPGETYALARQRAKDCLREQAGADLRLGKLDTYSPKFAAILEGILATPGSSLLYSQFYDMEGISIFRICMDLNGFSPIEIINTAAGPAFSAATEESLRKGPDSGENRYITFSGAESEDIRRLALDVFNAKFDELPSQLKTVLFRSGFTNNHRGQLCRVFCITSAGAEGLSLKNVRAVHIMEPYWNDVRLRQVKGRAIRIGSHLELPEDQRNVSIYTYVSVFGEEMQTAKEGDAKIDESIRLRDMVSRKEAELLNLPIPKTSASYVLTSDERLFVIAERKKRVIEELEKVMKQSAIDCQLNAPENQEVKCMVFPLTDKVGDFLYHPLLEQDIKESGSQFESITKVTKLIAWKGVKYVAVEKAREAGLITSFDLFPYADKEKLVAGVTLTPVGSTGAKDNLPSAPITIL